MPSGSMQINSIVLIPKASPHSLPFLWMFIFLFTLRCWWPNLVKHCYIGYIRQSRIFSSDFRTLHWFQAGYIWPRMDISDVSDISDFWSGSSALARAPGRIYSTQGGNIWCVRHIRPPSGSIIVAAGSDRIYPTSIRYIRLDQNQHSWIQNLRAKTQIFEDLMCFEAWKMTRRHQGAKMKRFMLKAELVKIGPSGLGYRTLQFSLKR
jgi:hypothetical protein